MAEITYTEAIDIAAPPESVFDYRLDFTTLPAYNPHVTNLRRTDHGSEPGPGAQYLFDLSLPGAPGPMETPLRVLQADRPGTVVIETGPDFMALETCRFSATPDGTHVGFETTLRFPGDIDEDSAKAIEASGREQAHIELDLMKKILEG